MKVIVVGAGEVGSYVTERLSREGHDVALIERSGSRAGVLEPELDALVIRGSGTDPRVLAEAGTDRADLFVAVTSSDETNIVSAMLARQSGAARRIIRVQDRGLRAAIAGELKATTSAGGGANGSANGTDDLLIDPDEETASAILNLVANPGVIELESLAGGEIVVVGVRLHPRSPLVGRTLAEVGQHYEPEWPFIFGVITRGSETISPRGDHRLEAGDLLRVVCTDATRDELKTVLGLRRGKLRRVILLGGGRTAELVAERLVDRVKKVIIIEGNPRRAAQLADRLARVEVLRGDFTDTDFLTEIDVGLADLVVALTGEDDANILGCLFAKSSGVGETITTAHRLSLLPLLGEIGVDGALSPRTATANAVLRMARDDVAKVITFLHGDIEVVELEIPPGARAADTAIADLHLTKDMLIAAVLSAGQARIARGPTVVRAGDRVVVLTKPSALGEVRGRLI
ncbi:MAG: Trk system potassium transporter TrkA [Acidimicrobiales bacterium]